MKKYIIILVLTFLCLNGISDSPGRISRTANGEISFKGLSKFPKLDFYSYELNSFENMEPLKEGKSYIIKSGYHPREVIKITDGITFECKSKIFKPKIIEYFYHKGNLLILIKGIDKDKNLIVETQYIKRKKKSTLGIFSFSENDYFNPTYLLVISFLAMFGIFFYVKRRNSGMSYY